MDSLGDKRAGNKEGSILAPYNNIMTEGGEKEMVKEASDDVKTGQEEPRQTVAASEEQEETVSSTESNKDQDASKKLSGSLEVNGKQLVLQDSAELEAQRTEQTPVTQLDDLKTANVEYQDASPPETSNAMMEDKSDVITSIGELPTASHKRDNSSGSVDSSWSKVSEEELKTCNNGEKEGMKFEIERVLSFLQLANYIWMPHLQNVLWWVQSLFSGFLTTPNSYNSSGATNEELKKKKTDYFISDKIPFTQLYLLHLKAT